MSEYRKILECWHKLEHFNPAIPPKGNNILKFSNEILSPWSGINLTRIYT